MSDKVERTQTKGQVRPGEEVVTLEALPSYKTNGELWITVTAPQESAPSAIAAAAATTTELYFWVTWVKVASATKDFTNWAPTDLNTKDHQSQSFSGAQENAQSYQETSTTPSQQNTYFGITTRVYPNQGTTKQPAVPLAQNLYQLNANGSTFTPVAWPT